MTDSRSFQIIAPAFNLPPHSDAEAFGSAVWLWMHGPNHRNLPLTALDHMLLPAIRLRQYVLILEERPEGITRPIGYLGWANLSAEAESRYLRNPYQGLRNEDWNSGDRMWLVDFFAPFGDSQKVHALWSPFFANASVRYMYHRSHERGVTVRTLNGAQVDPAHARQWWTDRPMLAASHGEATSTLIADGAKSP